MFEDTVEHRLRPLAAAFAESDLVRIRVADGTTEIELRRSSPGARVAAGAGAAGEQTNHAYEVMTAEVVGVVHFARPVEEGHLIEGDRELAFVTSLGIRNPVRSRGAGRIACVYVSDGQPVDYGQPLFAIDRS
jgi:acetyl-CoA carboxylase biotin carboxyl carrier protein